MGKVKGLDVGTMNLVGAEQNAEGKIKLKLIRHTFLDIDANAFTMGMLKKQKVQYAELGGKVYILGDSAFELANIMNKTVRRPMQDGVMSPGEADAVPIFGLLIDAVLGKPEEKGQLCYYSVPADPIDANFNIVYHSSVIAGALKNLGYTPKPMNEGHAVVFAELGDEDFTGIGISGGGGMFNICVCYKTIPAVSFSTSRAGDWIDKNVAQVLGIKVNRATAIKEKGININKPANREEEAVCIYYRNLINYTLTNIKNKFEKAEQIPQFPKPVDIVCAGGSSMIGGFVDVFKEELKKMTFPIEINNVRLADEPLYATARGCLLAGLSEVE
ncbi:MAG: cell division FtsA domain-containing protein [Candidatus Omnitrophica bacterium]|nr:cell division FtsA domain-containing protein [Candidatus Omnitrophota bacterium]